LAKRPLCWCKEMHKKRVNGLHTHPYSHCLTLHKMLIEQSLIGLTKKTFIINIKAHLSNIINLEHFVQPLWCFFFLFLFTKLLHTKYTSIQCVLRCTCRSHKAFRHFLQSTQLSIKIISYRFGLSSGLTFVVSFKYYYYCELNSTLGH